MNLAPKLVSSPTYQLCILIPSFDAQAQRLNKYLYHKKLFSGFDPHGNVSEHPMISGTYTRLRVIFTLCRLHHAFSILTQINNGLDYP